MGIALKRIRQIDELKKVKVWIATYVTQKSANV
jgi:hypothetical protein